MKITEKNVKVLIELLNDAIKRKNENGTSPFEYSYNLFYYNKLNNNCYEVYSTSDTKNCLMTFKSVYGLYTFLSGLYTMQDLLIFVNTGC